MKAILEQLIIDQINESKIEPLQGLDLLKYIKNVPEDKLESILESSQTSSNCLLEQKMKTALKVANKGVLSALNKYNILKRKHFLDPNNKVLSKQYHDAVRDLIKVTNKQGAGAVGIAGKF
jgi:hypothetical protein